MCSSDFRSFKKALLPALLLCLLVWLPSVAAAQERVLEKAYWTDTSGVASFEQARAASYTPYRDVLSKGFSNHVQWVRLKIAPLLVEEGDALVLRLRPVYVDQITLFDPVLLAQGIGPASVGDRTPWESNQFESLNHNLLIPGQANERYVWLRLQTTSTQLLHAEALTPREMLREEHTLWLVYSALLALIMSFLLWVLMAWLRDRDPVNGVFVIRQTVLLIYTACFLGYHRILLADWLSPAVQDTLYNWLVLFTTGLSVAFECRFLMEYRLTRGSRRLLRMLLAWSLFAMALMLFGQTRLSLQTNMLLNGVAVICLLLVSLRLKRPHVTHAYSAGYQLPPAVVSVYYVAVLLVLVLNVLPSLGLLSGTLYTVYGVLLYGVVSGFFMTALLIVRSRKAEALRLDTANRLNLSQQQLELETQRRQDQSQLISMLMHELKTPLAVIDLAVKTRERDDRTEAYVTRAIDNMKAILQRCVQTDRMVESPFQPVMDTVDLAQHLRQSLIDTGLPSHRLQADLPFEAPVRTDLQCLQIIMSNLLDNAIKFGSPDRAIKVTLDRIDSPHAFWRLQVVNAPGQAGWPDADKVFGKYYRHAAAQRISGTGLGLYLCDGLARQVGATLRYCPTDQHIVFELCLPI